MMNETLQNKYKGFVLGKTDPLEYFYDEFNEWIYDHMNICNGDMLINVLEDGITFDSWFRDYHEDLWLADHEYWQNRMYPIGEAV